MKPKLKIILWGLAVVAGLASLTAEPKNPKKAATSEPDITRNIRVQFEYIEMPLTTMSTLMDDKKATATDTALRIQVTELIKQGKAKIIQTQILTVPDRQKATSQSIRELLYPTEYEPAESAAAIHIPKDDDTDEKIAVKNTATGPTPTAFETRNTGETLEVEASIHSGAPYILMRYAPEIVTYTGNTIYAEWRDERGKADIVMPNFYTLRITGAITVANAKPTLLGTLSPKDDKGITDASRKILVFGKATILATK
ncbi:MAG: hypothetical protein QNL01_03960 [Akkermansiaceae bacterium]